MRLRSGDDRWLPAQDIRPLVQPTHGLCVRQIVMARSLAYRKEFAFNAICPYYTMFPLEYPLRIIRKHRQRSTTILDPFCGRGTTLYAARKLGVTSYGFDTSPIAAAIARAKLASATVDDVIEL